MEADSSTVQLVAQLLGALVALLLLGFGGLKFVFAQVDRRFNEAQRQTEIQFQRAQEQTQQQFQQVFARLDRFETRFGKLETRFGSLETRIGSLETRLKASEVSLGQFEHRLAEVEHRLAEVEGRQSLVERRLDDLRLVIESRFDRILNRIEDLNSLQRRMDRAVGFLEGALMGAKPGGSEPARVAAQAAPEPGNLSESDE